MELGHSNAPQSARLWNQTFDFCHIGWNLGCFQGIETLFGCCVCNFFLSYPTSVFVCIMIENVMQKSFDLQLISLNKTFKLCVYQKVCGTWTFHPYVILSPKTWALTVTLDCHWQLNSSKDLYQGVNQRHTNKSSIISRQNNIFEQCSQSAMFFKSDFWHLSYWLKPLMLSKNWNYEPESFIWLLLLYLFCYVMQKSCDLQLIALNKTFKLFLELWTYFHTPSICVFYMCAYGLHIKKHPCVSELWLHAGLFFLFLIICMQKQGWMYGWGCEVGMMLSGLGTGATRDDQGCSFLIVFPGILE